MRGKSKSIPGQGEFWLNTGLESDDGMMCGLSRLWPTAKASDADRGTRGELNHMVKGATSPRGPSISSAVDSHALIYPMPAKEQDSQENNLDSGTSSPVLFAFFDPDTYSWRTCQLSLLGGWMPFSGRWPRTGMTRNGRAFRLQALVPRISGIACSLWPTPDASVANDGETVESWDARRAIVKQTANNGNGFGKRLTIEAKRYPIPSARDWKNGHASEVTHARNSRPLNEQIVKQEVNGQSIQPKSSLNPAWVEWLMGFPPGWTDLGNAPQESQVESMIEPIDFGD